MSTNVLRNQIFKSGYYYSMSHHADYVYAYLHAEKSMDIPLFGKFDNITRALTTMLDKIAELGVSGKYLTKEMIKDE